MNKAYMISVGVLSGLAAGAVLGLLFAPKRGSDTRAMIKERAEKARAKASETASSLRRRVRNMTPIGAD